jgi:hypothetical protein
MTRESQDAPQMRWTWTMPATPAILSGFGAAFCVVIALILFALAVWVARVQSLGVGAFMLAMTAVIVLLALYVARDARGKWGGRITIDGGRIALDLPPGRSLVYDPPACKTDFPLADIAAVETRLVALSSLGAANMQRPYRIVKRDGSEIFLFEDRALGTVLATPAHDGVAGEIARRAGAPLNDLGMARGSAGLLGVAFVRPPAWSDQALPKGAETKLWRSARFTGLIALVAVVLAFVLFLIF